MSTVDKIIAEKFCGGIAIKHDEEKIRMDCFPSEAIEEISKVLTFGAKKYDDWNWAKGFKWSRLLGALLRHVFAWARGEDKDSETGLSHLAHAGCCIVFLLYHEKYHRNLDDRFKRPTSEVTMKFNAGDKIKCIQVDNFCLTLGKVYTVLKSTDTSVNITNDQGDEIDYSNHRFELVESPRVPEKKIDIEEYYEDGSIDYQEYYKDGKQIKEPKGCSDKIVTIEGKQYKLQEI